MPNAPKNVPPVVFLVHGYNVKDGGEATIDQLLPALDKAPCFPIEYDYGYTGMMDILKHNKDYASELRDISINFEDEQFAIGHSNGCAIIVEAARQGAEFKRVLLINPALQVDTKFPDTIGEVLVVHTKHDVPTRAARWGNRIPFLRWFVPPAWGAMGAKGGTHAHYNYNLSEFIFGHSAVFNSTNMPLWDKFLVGEVLRDASYFDRDARLSTQKGLVRSFLLALAEMEVEDNEHC